MVSRFVNLLQVPRQLVQCSPRPSIVVCGFGDFHVNVDSDRYFLKQSMTHKNFFLIDEKCRAYRPIYAVILETHAPKG